MSQIANALHKAKERTGHTSAPFMIPGHAPAIVVPVKVKNTQRIWVVLLSFVIVLGGLAIWYSGKHSLNSDTPATTTSNQGTQTVSGAEHSTKPNTSGNDPAPNTETQDIVNALVISAVMPGSTPRIMMRGHVISIGQEAEAGLIFSGVIGDRLIFTDSKGATYSRRY